MKVTGLRLIFYKDWGQIGCKYFDCTEKLITHDEVKLWLVTNHPSVVRHKLKIIRN